MFGRFYTKTHYTFSTVMIKTTSASKQVRSTRHLPDYAYAYALVYNVCLAKCPTSMTGSDEC